MGLARAKDSNVQMDGEVRPLLILRNGFYARGMPSELPLRYRVRSWWLETKLHLRLAAKGF